MLKINPRLFELARKHSEQSVVVNDYKIPERPVENETPSMDNSSRYNSGCGCWSMDSGIYMECDAHRPNYGYY